LNLILSVAIAGEKVFLQYISLGLQVTERELTKTQKVNLRRSMFRLHHHSAFFLSSVALLMH
jgi:hypothetical protein